MAVQHVARDWKWTVSPKAAERYAYQCYERAGYLSRMQTGGVVPLGMFSLVCIFVLVYWLRRIGNQALEAYAPIATSIVSPPAVDTDTGDASTPTSPSAVTTLSPDQSSASETSTEDPPPAYDSQSAPLALAAALDTVGSSAAEVEQSFWNARARDARWRAETFVISTLLLGLLTVSLATFGFAIQHLFYCPDVDFTGYEVNFWNCVVWIVFGLLVCFASSGLVACLVKFLALWGPTTEVGRGKVLGYTIFLDAIPAGLFGTVAFLVGGIVGGSGYLVVEGILACQRFCCPGASEEYAEVAAEDVEMGVQDVPKDGPTLDGQTAM